MNNEKYIRFKVKTLSDSKSIQEFLFSLGYMWCSENRKEYYYMNFETSDILLCLESDFNPNIDHIFHGDVEILNYDKRWMDKIIKSYDMSNYKDFIQYKNAKQLGLI